MPRRNALIWQKPEGDSSELLVTSLDQIMPHLQRNIVINLDVMYEIRHETDVAGKICMWFEACRKLGITFVISVTSEAPLMPL